MRFARYSTAWLDRRLRRLLLLGVAAFLITGCGSTSGAQGSATAGASPARTTLGTGSLRTITLRSGGLKRTYLLYAPSSDSRSHRLPLVLVFHGADDTAANTTTETGLLALAEQQHNMIVAFLQGVQDTWNDDAGDPPAERENVNDVGFTEAVLRQVESRLYVNRRRVVATGLSNGAILVELLGCRAAAYLTLAVPVEGQLGEKFAGSCRPAAPVSVYEVHATADQSIPYAGGTFAGVGGPVRVLSAPASAARWSSIDRCGKKSGSTSGGSIFTLYTACRDGVSVTLNSIQGGKHQWPPGFAQTLVGVIDSMTGTRTAAVPKS